MIDTSQTNGNGVRQRFIIYGCLTSLNEYIRTERANRQAAAATKRKQQEIVSCAIKQLHGWKTEKPVYIKYTWIEKNKRKDKSNVAFAKKFIEDALVKCGVIPDDGWDNVVGFSDDFDVDKNNPRVIVDIFER